MPKSKSELMAALRLKRHKLKQIYIQIWINKKDESEVLQFLSKFRIDKPKDIKK